MQTQMVAVLPRHLQPDCVMIPQHGVAPRDGVRNGKALGNALDVAVGNRERILTILGEHRLPDFCFIKLRNKHGLTVRFHDLRHYCASLMLALGVPDLYAMERMGHSPTHMLKSVYQHTMKDKQDEVAISINAAVEERFS